MTIRWPEKSKGMVDLHQNKVLIYGRPKYGKSSLLADFPDALFLTTEDGVDHLSVAEWRIKSWLEFCGRVTDLEKNIADCPFKTVVIDTVDNLADMCVEFILQKYKVETLNDVGYGKGYAAFTREFKKQVNRLAALGLGVAMTSHAESQTVPIDSITNPYGPMLADMEEGTVEMIVPSLDKRARKFLLGLVDIIGYLDLDKDLNRVLYFRPTKYFEAGDRTQGRLPASMIVPKEGAYKALCAAYYGDNTELVGKVEDALAYMKDNKMDAPAPKFTGELADADIEDLQGYLQELRMAAKNAKK